MGNGTVATGVREYAEEMAVKIDKWEGRYIVEAYNEAGYNSTMVDLVDLLKYVRTEMPELLEKEDEN